MDTIPELPLLPLPPQLLVPPSQTHLGRGGQGDVYGPFTRRQLYALLRDNAAVLHTMITSVDPSERFILKVYHPSVSSTPFLSTSRALRDIIDKHPSFRQRLILPLGYGRFQTRDPHIFVWYDVQVYGGVSLQTFLSTFPTPASVATVLRSLVDCLDVVLGCVADGVLLTDIKPTNLVVSPTLRVRLIDVSVLVLDPSPTSQGRGQRRASRPVTTFAQSVTPIQFFNRRFFPPEEAAFLALLYIDKSRLTMRHYQQWYEKPGYEASDRSDDPSSHHWRKIARLCAIWPFVFLYTAIVHRFFPDASSLRANTESLLRRMKRQRIRFDVHQARDHLHQWSDELTSHPVTTTSLSL